MCRQISCHYGFLIIVALWLDSDEVVRLGDEGWRLEEWGPLGSVYWRFLFRKIF